MVLTRLRDARVLAPLLVLIVAACSGGSNDPAGAGADDLRKCPPSPPAPTTPPIPTTTTPPPPPPPPPPAPGSLLFADGWETSGALGCNDTALLDGAWDDYGGSGACSGSVHDADIVDDVRHDGAHSLRITQKPGGINGTDFRILKTVGDQAEVTLTGWVRYDSNYRWATADHKVFIFVDGAQTAQNVYVNTRGVAGDPTHTRLLLAAIPAGGTVFSDGTPSHLITTNTWYRIRVHLVAGDHGRMEAWLTPEGQAEMKLDLVYEAGPMANIDDLAVGSIGGVKADSTYNDGANVIEPMYQWYDTIALYRGLYVGD